MTGSPQGVSRLLGDDHGAIDDRLERFRSTPPEEAADRIARWSAFAQELRHHIDLEETQLFPVMVDAGGAPARLVSTLLEEHRKIRSAMDRLEAAVVAGIATTEPLVRELVDGLWEHNAREEGAVYPWLDEHLTPEQLAGVRRALGDPPAEPR